MVIRLFLFTALTLLTLNACSSGGSSPPVTEDQADVDYDILLATPDKPLSFMDEVQPVLDKRCVVCHGCYDAPCQLKLNSFAGVSRGANPEKVYNGSRIKAATKTRLFVDAQTTEEWRQMDFHSVLNETPDSTPKANLENSAMYQILRLKQLNPQPKAGMLNDDVDTSLNREQSCAKPDKFPKFAKKHADWGMPYGLPNLAQDEYATLVQWIAQGSPDSEAPETTAAGLKQIESWESFLNQEGLKAQLVARYIFEHLVQGHIYFKDGDEQEFFRLIRSSTPPGTMALEIASNRPYSDPAQDFWYRVIRYVPHIVIKDHIPYEWSAQKMARYKELFFEIEYDVTESAPYGQKLAANPFRVFEAIPPTSRYEFLLDDARFFIQGFMKGPVCRGQVALNVIDDRFWIVFMDPRKDIQGTDPKFLNNVIEYLELPDDRGDTLNLRAIWSDYWKRQRQYLEAKLDHFKTVHTSGLGADETLSYIWNGGGVNPNAALTIYRHMDSASVTFGHQGDFPETAWVIDYPLLERIHYLLVAGFDVYGNVGHQLNTRLYMDFLRMEGEDYFLAMLPQSKRKEVRDSWYVGVHANVEKHFEEPVGWLEIQSGLNANPENPVESALTIIGDYLGPKITGGPDPINRCDDNCFDNSSPTLQKINKALRQVASIKGNHLKIFPDNSFLRIRMPDGEPDLAYSIILNKGYTNLNSMLESEDKRDTSEDTLTIVPGLEGSYPNFFYSVDIENIDQFTEEALLIRNRDGYERFVAKYGIRRTNQEFWAMSDWFHAAAKKQDPIESGIYDLNRYRNR